jgi:streptogramin lyase
MNADGTGIVTLGSGFSFPAGVAVQADGRILVADTFNNAIKRMNADGTGIVTLGTGFSGPRGVAEQADGRILVADAGNNAIKRITNLLSNRVAVSVTVNPNVTPTFTAVAPICSGASLSALPTTSTNGITGTWSPALNNTATTTYTFTPTTGFCANIATMSIIV